MDDEEKKYWRMVRSENIKTRRSRRKERIRHASKCKYRGDKIGTRKCRTCTGNIGTTIYSCVIHGKCAIAGQGTSEIRVCVHCNECEPKE